MATIAYKTATIFYDGQCPFCTNYVKLLHLRQMIAELTLIDARGGSALVKEMQDRGVNLDEGMVLILDGKVFHGADCLNQIVIQGLSKGPFAAVNARLFGSRRVARFFYPILKMGRRIILRLLGRGSIQAVGKLGP
jgi:predicted DCC family thiol-disulfide oxidoreductase YuxK